MRKLVEIKVQKWLSLKWKTVNQRPTRTVLLWAQYPALQVRVCLHQNYLRKMGAPVETRGSLWAGSMFWLAFLPVSLEPDLSELDISFLSRDFYPPRHVFHLHPSPAMLCVLRQDLELPILPATAS